MAAIAALEPAPVSANDACRRLSANRARVLAAYAVWRASAGSAAGTAAVVDPVVAARERARLRLWLEAEEWPP